METRDLFIIYDGLDSTATGEALSANMGRVLNENHNNLAQTVNSLQQTVNDLDVALDSEWLTPTFAEGVREYSGNFPCAYRKVGNLVELRGAVAGVDERLKLLFTLPVGFRPNGKSYKVGATASGGSFNFQIDTNGEVTVIADANGYDATKYYFIDCMFFVD